VIVPYRQPAKVEDVRKQIVLTKSEVRSILLKALRASGQLPETFENETKWWTRITTLNSDNLNETGPEKTWDESSAVAFEWIEKVLKE